jgi:hypothetical protein
VDRGDYHPIPNLKQGGAMVVGPAQFNGQTCRIEQFESPDREYQLDGFVGDPPTIGTEGTLTQNGEKKEGEITSGCGSSMTCRLFVVSE